MDYTRSRPNIDRQLADIRSRVQSLTHGLDEAAINWQPDAGRGWSIGQCLDHLARTTELYGQALDVAIQAAPEALQGPPPRPNLIGRVLIWAVEPPARMKVKAIAGLSPASHHEVTRLLRQFDESLDRLSGLADRALRIDAFHTRYANPLAGGVRFFNVVTGLMVMLAHNRRHLDQAEKVKALRG